MTGTVEYPAIEKRQAFLLEQQWPGFISNALHSGMFPREQCTAANLARWCLDHYRRDLDPVSVRQVFEAFADLAYPRAMVAIVVTMAWAAETMNPGEVRTPVLPVLTAEGETLEITMLVGRAEDGSLVTTVQAPGARPAVLAIGAICECIALDVEHGLMEASAE